MSLPQAIATGTRHTEIVEHVDVVPTIVDYCGIQVPPQLQGRSVRSLLEGRPYEARTSAFIEHHLPGGLSYKAVRTPDRLYAMHADGHQELYDLAHDPAQLHNVAGEPAHRDALHDARAELLRRWFDVQSRTPMPTGQY
jgi:choline-sulfatase